MYMYKYLYIATSMPQYNVSFQHPTHRRAHTHKCNYLSAARCHWQCIVPRHAEWNDFIPLYYSIRFISLRSIYIANCIKEAQLFILIATVIWRFVRIFISIPFSCLLYICVWLWARVSGCIFWLQRVFIWCYAWILS